MKRCVITSRGKDDISKRMERSTSLPKKLCDTVANAIEAREDEIRKSVIRQTTKCSPAHTFAILIGLFESLATENVSKTKEKLKCDNSRMQAHFFLLLLLLILSSVRLTGNTPSRGT